MRTVDRERRLCTRLFAILGVDNDRLDGGGPDIEPEKQAHRCLPISLSAPAAAFSSVTSTLPMRPCSAAAITGTLLVPPAISITAGARASFSIGNAMARELMPWLICRP